LTDREKAVFLDIFGILIPGGESYNIVEKEAGKELNSWRLNGTLKNHREESTELSQQPKRGKVSAGRGGQKTGRGHFPDQQRLQCESAFLGVGGKGNYRLSVVRRLKRRNFKEGKISSELAGRN